jgi:carboxymethylenebutenolidase
MRQPIPTDDGGIDGYLARPASGPGPWPGVVVVHDALGMGTDIRRIADTVADAGFVVLAPDLYSRGGRLKCIRTVFTEMLAGRGRAFDDLEGARKLLAGHEDCTGKIGVVGFCMGGGFALVAASGGFDASAPYYGMLPRDLSILDDACPVVASFGKRDPVLIGAAGKLERALTERGIPHDVKEYPGAGHSFANQFPFGPLNRLTRIAGFGFHHEANADAYRRVFSFFHEHLS